MIDTQRFAAPIAIDGCAYEAAYAISYVNLRGAYAPRIMFHNLLSRSAQGGVESVPFTISIELITLCLLSLRQIIVLSSIRIANESWRLSERILTWLRLVMVQLLQRMQLVQRSVSSVTLKT